MESLRSPHNSVSIPGKAVVLREIGNSTPLVKIKGGKGKASTSIIQEIQRHPITDKYLHVDFREVADDEQVVLEVPCTPEGSLGELRTKMEHWSTLATRCPFELCPKTFPTLSIATSANFGWATLSTSESFPSSKELNT